MFESLRDAKISSLVESRPLLSESDRVGKATGMLRERGEYEVFLTKEGRLALATVRDLLSVKNPDSERLGSVAYYAPSLEATETVGKAATLMFEYRLRALPCSEKKGSVKIISASGILSQIGESEASKLKASQIMTSNLTTMSPEDSAEKARQTMMQRTFDHLPIVKDSKIVGIVTSSQLLFRLLPEEGIPAQFRGREVSRLDFPVSRIGDEATLQVKPSDSLWTVLSTMSRNGSSYVLVTESGSLKGIITVRDVMSVLVTKESVPLPYYIVGLPTDPFQAEAAKSKLEKLGTSLTRSYPSIEEIRAVIKTKQISKSRSRYEVTVAVYTPGGMNAYAAEGYDLAMVFESIGVMLKGLMASRQSKVTRTHGGTLRKRAA